MNPLGQQTIELSKESFKFSAAHMSFMGGGKKERLHGHNYYVKASLRLKLQDGVNFLDFNIFKQILQRLCDRWDERVLLAKTGEDVRWSKQGEDIEYIACGVRYVFPASEVCLLDCDNVIVEHLVALMGQVFLEEIQNTLGSEHPVATLYLAVEETRGQSSGQEFHAGVLT